MAVSCALKAFWGKVRLSSCACPSVAYRLAKASSFFERKNCGFLIQILKIHKNFIAMKYLEKMMRNVELFSSRQFINFSLDSSHDEKICTFFGHFGRDGHACFRS
jgi:hypothetical protein